MTDLASSFFDLSLVLQLALGSGYLAYVTAYAGLKQDHIATDQLFITLAFSSVAMVIVKSAETFAVADVWRVIGTLLFAVILGAAWRVIGRPIWHKILRVLNIHREDGVYSGWASLVQTKRGVSQATIYTKNGLVMHLADRTRYKDADWGGLYLCGDGSVIMIVETETNVEEPEKEREREDISDHDWGTRFTYIPSTEIQRVELRMKR